MSAAQTAPRDSTCRFFGYWSADQSQVAGHTTHCQGQAARSRALASEAAGRDRTTLPVTMRPPPTQARQGQGQGQGASPRLRRGRALRSNLLAVPAPGILLRSLTLPLPPDRSERRLMSLRRRVPHGPPGDGRPRRFPIGPRRAGKDTREPSRSLDLPPSHPCTSYRGSVSSSSLPIASRSLPRPARHSSGRARRRSPSSSGSPRSTLEALSSAGAIAAWPWSGLPSPSS